LEHESCGFRAGKVTLIEDAAESLGTKYKGKHTGTFGDYGILSFLENKVFTSETDKKRPKNAYSFAPSLQLYLRAGDKDGDISAVPEKQVLKVVTILFS